MHWGSRVLTFSDLENEQYVLLTDLIYWFYYSYRFYLLYIYRFLLQYYCICLQFSFVQSFLFAPCNSYLSLHFFCLQVFCLNFLGFFCLQIFLLTGVCVYIFFVYSLFDSFCLFFVYQLFIYSLVITFFHCFFV